MKSKENGIGNEDTWEDTWTEPPFRERPHVDLTEDIEPDLDEDLLKRSRSNVDLSPPTVEELLLLKGKIEAALFITGRALTLKEIADIVDNDLFTVEQALLELMNDYAFREHSALEIDDTDGYILQIREDYGDIVNKMMPVEITPAALRTLSAIAIKAPILQSALIDVRGANAYDHIAELLAKKLISKRREGRSFVLNTTKTFQNYFKLQGDKRELEYLVREEAVERQRAKIQRAEAGHPSEDALEPDTEAS